MTLQCPKGPRESWAQCSPKALASPMRFHFQATSAQTTPAKTCRCRQYGYVHKTSPELVRCERRHLNLSKSSPGRCAVRQPPQPSGPRREKKGEPCSRRAPPELFEYLLSMRCLCSISCCCLALKPTLPLPACSFACRMVLKISKQALTFPFPMGTRHLHLFQLLSPPARGYAGPMVVLAEVHSQIFGGEGCPSPISSSSTLLKRVHDIGHKHHWEVCTDRAIITSLASHTIIPSTRAKALVVLSLPCLLSLLHASYCPPSLTLPVSLLSSRRAQIMQECTLHSPPPPASPSFSFSPPPPPSPLTSAPPPAPAPAADHPSLQLQLQLRPSSYSPSSPSLAALRVAE